MMRRIDLAVSDSLPTPMPRRPSASDLIVRKMRERGIASVRELAAKATAKGYSISNTAINAILRGDTKNPGVYTLEAVAVGLGDPPALFIAELLGDKLEDPNFKAGQFGTLADLYKSMTSGQRTKAEPHIDGLTLQLQHIKNQK